jgi:hypothetical protein
MTKKTVKGAKPAAKKAKRLSLSKKTLKDLTALGKGPLGGRRPAGGLVSVLPCSLKIPCI